MVYQPATTVGKAWAVCDQSNDEINAAAMRHGVPANLLKAMVNRESSCNWVRDGHRTGDVGRKKPDGSINHILPFVGIFETTAESWGYDFDAMIGNKAMQIDAMAYGIAKLARDYGGGDFGKAATVYFGGVRALDNVFCDEYGMCSDEYTRKAVEDWRALDLIAGGNVAPKVWDIRTDYARFGLSVDERDTILRKREHRGTYRPSFIVLHVQDGFTKNSLRYWLPKSASSTVMVNLDGSVLRVIAEEDVPWTNGDDQRPNAWGQRIIAAGGGDPNNVTLSIETEGMSDGTHPQAQIDAVVWQCRAWMAKYGIPLANVGRHSDINTVDPWKIRCPGPYADQVIRELGAVVPPPVEPVWVFGVEGMTETRAKAVFGAIPKPGGGIYKYDPIGSVTKEWGKHGAETGCWGTLLSVDVEVIGGKTWRYFEFSDGFVIVAQPDGTVRPLKGAT